MQKTKSNAHWAKLTPDQLKTLDKWLFDEKLSYPATLALAKSKLGFQGSEASLQRYYTRRRKERVMDEFEDLREDLQVLADAPEDADSLREGSLKLMARFLFRRLQEAPDEITKWAPVAALILQDNRTEMLREAKAREDETRRQVLEFAKERFHYDMTEKALTALPELKELADAKRDPQTKRYEEYARLNRLRRKMFGVGQEVQPENAQEEAEMLAAKREREGKPTPTAESPQEQITETQPPGPSSKYYKEYMATKAKREGGMSNDEIPMTKELSMSNDQGPIKAPSPGNGG